MKNPIERIITTLLAGIIIFVMLLGSVLYLVNYANQIEQKKEIEYAAFKLNNLNEIYITHLKMVRENNYYRLNKDLTSEKKYNIYRNRTIVLINNYKNDIKESKDSILFKSFYQLLNNRINDLDERLQKSKLQPFYSASTQENNSSNKLVYSLETNHQLLIKYWDNKSTQASANFDDKKKTNDLLFLIWLIVSVVLTILYIITFRKNINSQLEKVITERTLAITQEKEKEFSSAFANASIGMGLVSTNGRWIRVNKSLCNLLGYSELELMSLTFQEITYPDDLDADLENVKKLLNKEIESYQMEKRYITKSGEIVWILLSGSLVWENQEPKHFIAQIQNINARKILEKQLAEEKYRLKQIIDGTDAGTWEWNVQTNQIIFNEKWAQMIGYTLKDLEPTTLSTWQQFAHPDDLIISSQKLEDYFEGRSNNYECVCRLKHKSGEWVWVLSHGKVMTKTKNNQPEWVFGSHIDITSIKKLEQELEFEKQKFSTIFNSTFQFIGFLETDGTLIEANHTAINFAGLKPQDVIGKKFWDCHWWQISPQTQDELKLAIAKAAKGEMVNYEVAVWDERKNPVTILFNLKPLKNLKGEVISIIPEGTIIQELVNYRKNLESKNQELEGFASVAAHDLKEPLRMINQFMGKLSQKYQNQLDETAQKYIHFAVDGSKRMNNLINDLLAYAELGGAHKNSFTNVNLNEVFEDTKKLNEAVLEEKNAQLLANNLPTIWGQKTAMQLLFQNLIGNGLKYQPLYGAKPKIEINLINEDKLGYTISFKDNGIGISKENQNKVFNLFARLQNKFEYAGTGMGLATCKKIVELHHGRIWVNSDLGEGATFMVFIPKQKV